MSRFAFVSATVLAFCAIGGHAICATATDQSALTTAQTAVAGAITAAGTAAIQSNSPDGSTVAAPVLGAAGAIVNSVLGGVVAGDKAADGAGATLDGAAPITSSDLGSTTGGANINIMVGAVSDQTLEATNTGNTMTVGGSMTNGPITVGANAFSGFSGIGNFVMNTGNQNNVQGSLNVTIVGLPAATPSH